MAEEASSFKDSKTVEFASAPKAIKRKNKFPQELQKPLKMIAEQASSQSAEKTPSCQSKSVNIQIIKHDCTLSNAELKEIKNMIYSDSEFDIVEFCDCKIVEDYRPSDENKKNKEKCKISKLIISYTDHFKDFSRLFYSTFVGCEIKSLCLVYANLEDQDVETLQSFLEIKQVKGIESLDISYNKKIGPDGFGKIGNIITKQGIKRLIAIDCNLGEMKLAKLFQGLKNVNLQELDIGYNDSLKEGGFEMLARLVESKGIEILKLCGCQLTEKNVQVFYNKLEKTSERVLLNELDVSYNPEMNPAGCKVLGLIMKKFEITTLNLAGCGISEDHLTSLTSIEGIKLHAINLRDNCYPGDIIVKIANIVRELEIQELDISDCMFSASELRNFRTGLNGTKLQKLHVGDEGCELDIYYIEEVCQLLQTVNEMLYLPFHRLDNSCRRRLLTEQSDKLSVSTLQLKNQQTTSDESLTTTSKAKTEKINAIIMFDESDKHMYSFNLPTKEWRRMQEFPEYDANDSFTTVVSGKHIYFIQYQKVHQLEYSDSAAEWKEMSSTIEEHGEDPPAAVLNGLIYVCGRGIYSADPSRSVERYDAALDRWDHVCDMNTARKFPCVVATEDHIYCIGGRDEQYERLQSVERFDGRLNKWEFVESAPTPIVFETAAVVKNRIYVTHSNYEGILCYDIQNSLWSEIDLAIQWPFMEDYFVKILAVDEELYIIGTIDDDEDKEDGMKFAIYLLKPETKQMTLVEEFEDKYIDPRTCLAVKL